MKNKNIWILNHYAITPDMPGGTRHFDFAKELNTRGYDVTIFASSFNHQQLKYLKLTRGEAYKIESYEGVRFIWIKTTSYKSNNWHRFVNMLSYMNQVNFIGRFLVSREEIEKPDIIIGSSVHLFAGLSAYRLSRGYKAKFVFEIRDLWPQTLVDLCSMSRYHPAVLLLGILEKFLCKRAKKIIVLLPNADKYLCKLGIDKGKIVYIPNGVDLKRFGDITCDVSNDGFFRIYYVGGHSQTDNLYVLLEAALKIKDINIPIRFVFIGDGIEKQKLVMYAKEKGLNGIVCFKSSVNKLDIPTYLMEADVLYLSMQDSAIYKYGISFNKLFDYMASGKPIILFGNPVDNIILKANAGVTVGNVDNLIKAIDHLYTMPSEERMEMGKRGREYIEKYHNIPVLVDKIEQIIREN